MELQKSIDRYQFVPILNELIDEGNKIVKATICVSELNSQDRKIRVLCHCPIGFVILIYREKVFVDVESGVSGFWELLDRAAFTDLQKALSVFDEVDGEDLFLIENHFRREMDYICDRLNDFHISSPMEVDSSF